MVPIVADSRGCGPTPPAQVTCCALRAISVVLSPSDNVKMASQSNHFICRKPPASFIRFRLLIIHLLSTHADAFLCVCTVTDFSGKDIAIGFKFCTVVYRLPGQGISHFG